jgi:hypothetical protein
MGKKKHSLLTMGVVLRGPLVVGGRLAKKMLQGKQPDFHNHV